MEKQTTKTDDKILNELKSLSSSKSEVLTKSINLLKANLGKALKSEEIANLLNDGTTAKNVRNSFQAVECKGTTPKILRNDKISSIPEGLNLQYFKSGNVFYGIAKDGQKVSR